jgi:arylsulfatase A-like enzyme
MAARRPNILWYCADQQRFDTIGALGNPHVHTPNLDRLVAEGVAFTHAYCQSPICTPSRSSFLTGRYPSGVRNNTNGNTYFHRDEPLVTKRLADSGYRGGLIGKLHLAGACYGREARVDDGYDFFRYSHAPRPDWPMGHDYHDWLVAKGANPNELLRVPDYRHVGVMEPTPERDNVPPALHQTTWATDEAIRFIDETGDQPWVLSINVFDPHPPYNPPWEYYRRFNPATLPGPHFRESDLAHQTSLVNVDFQSRPERPEEMGATTIQALYYAMIEQVDEQFGRLLDYLDQTGQRQHTIVIYMSDHGEALGDHGLTHKGCRFFDGLTRVPMIWSWPGQIAAGRVSDALVELTDIAPTLMEFAGLPVPTRMQGQSLRAVLIEPQPPTEHRAAVRSEFYDAIDQPNHSFGTMYRDRRWKLVVYHDTGLGELYDLEADPYEFDSLWDSPDHQAIKTDLLIKSYDASIRAMDYGPPRVMPY